MEKGNGGEKVAEKENGGERKVEVGDGGGERKVEVGDGGGEKEAPACFTKAAGGGDDATLLDTTKDLFKQLQVTSADTHWGCIKNRVRLAKDYVAEKTSSVFGRKKVEPEVKNDETLAAAAKEEGAKPATPAAGGESH